ncbi:MAG: T9SS type A sorting domain-containing protein, partial [Saprospiraceae bacterium]|nr:T9SS type A sorting domain-containing protein [Saprospiraceae bacterium]
ELDNKLSDIQLAPNPASHELTVRLSLTESASLRYAVRDIAGRMVMEGDMGQLNAGEYAQRIEVGQLPAGMYQLEIRLEQGLRTQKFVVQR